jgi:hypothetical protein
VRRSMLSSRSYLLAALAGLGLAGLGLFVPCPAAEKDGRTVKTIEYKGWTNNLLLSNGEVELILTLDVGPRILSYKFKDGKNVLKEYPEQLGKTGEKEWIIRGGHRLWTAPEDLTRTYAPDNNEIRFRDNGRLITLIPPADKEFGIQKEIDVELAGTGSEVKITHRIANIGAKPTALALWALTVLEPGGVEIIPLPPKKPHPGSVKNAKTPADFAPNQGMVLWPFFDFKDPRYTFGSRYITLKQDKTRGATKIGLAHKLGWIGYLNEGTLFVKRLEHQDGKTYPDGGCNFETFTNEDMIEMESLSPLVKLAAGEKAEMTERWHLCKDVAECPDETAIDKNVLPRIMGK